VQRAAFAVASDDAAGSEAEQVPVRRQESPNDSRRRPLVHAGQCRRAPSFEASALA
jgi:hypothetical protein